MLDLASYTIKTKFGIRMLKVIKESLTVMKGIIKDGLYILVGITVIAQTSPTQNQNLDQGKLWHHILGHIGQKGLDELVKQGMMGRDSLEKLSFHDNCVFGKITKISFKTATHKTKQTLNYIHYDL